MAQSAQSSGSDRRRRSTRVVRPTRRKVRRATFRTRDIALYGPISLLRHLWLQLVLLAGMFLAGATVYWFYTNPKPSAVDSMLWSVSTITTIGLYSTPGGIAIPQSEAILLIVLFLVAVGVAASLVQGVLSHVVDKEFWTEEALRREVARMRRHVVVAGYSRLGHYAVKKLEEFNVPYVVVVKPTEDVPALRRERVPAFASDVSSFHRVFHEVGIERAGTMLATFDDDSENLVAILNAKRLNPKLRVISAVHDHELEESSRMAGADVTLPTANILGDLLGLSAISTEVAGVLLSSRVPAKYIAEFELPPGARIPFSELNAIAPVLLVLQGGEILANPPDAFEVLGGSTIFVLATPEVIAQVREKLRGSRVIESAPSSPLTDDA